MNLEIFKFPFRALFQILIPYSRFPRIAETNLDGLSALIFRFVFPVFKVRTLKHYTSSNSFLVFPFSVLWDRFVYFGGSEDKDNGFERSLTFLLTLKMMNMKTLHLLGK